MIFRCNKGTRKGNPARNGFSVLEILIGVLILGLAIIPIFGISTTSTRSAFLVGRHMMATQIAQSLLEWFMARTFKDAVKEAQVLAGQTVPVTEDLVFQHILHSSTPENRDRIMGEFRRTFRQMQYVIEHEERDEPLHGRILLLKVNLYYRLAEEQSVLRRFTISTLKFPEDV